MSNGDYKIEIRRLQKEGRNDEALQKLRIIKINNNFNSIEDELFVNHCLAWHYSKTEGCNDLAKFYINENAKLFKDENVINERTPEYYKFLWLYSEIHYDEIPSYEYCDNFLEIYKYYKMMKDERYSMGAIENIMFRNKKEENTVKFMKHMVKKHGINSNLVLDMILDCKKKNHAYIEVTDVVNKYRNDISNIS